MKKGLQWGISALIGLGLGATLFTCFMVISVEGSTMLPDFVPGEKVLVNRLCSGEDVAVGDVVVLKAPYFSIAGEGDYVLRRVSGSRGSWLKVDWDTQTAEDQEMIVAKEAVLGKVIFPKTM